MPFSILDLLFIAVFALFAFLGAKKGLLLSLCSLLAVVVALIGATFLSDTLSPVLAAHFAPSLEEFLSQHLDAILAGQSGEEQGFLWVFVNEALQGIDPSAAEDFLTRLAFQATRLLLRPILFSVSFVVVLVAWTLLSRALDLVTRLPVLHTLNSVGGLLFGAAEGTVLYVVALFLIRAFLPDLIPPEWEKGSLLLKYLSPYGL